MKLEEDMARVKAVVEPLMEWYDSVQIFATRHDADDGTKSAIYGAGNWFARYGQVSSWLESKNEQTRVDVRKDEGQ